MATALSKIRALICDVDGSLCGPQLFYGAELSEQRRPAESEVGKLFHVRDGHRMVTALAAGLRIGVCTGRDSAPLRRRVQDLRLDPLLVSVPDKVAALREWAESAGFGLQEIAFLGDDYPDFPLIGAVGLFISPADADPAVLRRADWVTKAAAGEGAVAEIIEAILKAQGLWAPGGAQDMKPARLMIMLAIAACAASCQDAAQEVATSTPEPVIMVMWEQAVPPAGFTGSPGAPRNTGYHHHHPL